MKRVKKLNARDELKAAVELRFRKAMKTKACELTKCSGF